MKKTIPFNLFGEKQELCFTIGDMAPFERSLGKSAHWIWETQYVGYDFVFAALPLCLKNLNPHTCRDKVYKYMTDEDGRKIDDVAIPLIHAIAASGAFGKAAMDAAMKTYYPELVKAAEETEIKNE